MSTMSELHRQQLQDHVIDSLIYREYKEKEIKKDYMNGKIMNANLNEKI